jgi:hypothetical protein
VCKLHNDDDSYDEVMQRRMRCEMIMNGEQNCINRGRRTLSWISGSLQGNRSECLPPPPTQKKKPCYRCDNLLGMCVKHDKDRIAETSCTIVCSKSTTKTRNVRVEFLLFEIYLHTLGAIISFLRFTRNRATFITFPQPRVGLNSRYFTFHDERNINVESQRSYLPTV